MNRGGRNNTRRILNDYEAYMKEGAGLGIVCKPDDNDITKWEAVIFGPDDTEWEGGIFKLKIQFTDKYPYEPPIV